MAPGENQPDVGRAPQVVPRHVIRDTTYGDAIALLDIDPRTFDTIEMRVEYVITRIPEFCKVLNSTGHSVMDDDEEIPLRFFFTYDDENLYFVWVERK